MLLSNPVAETARLRRPQQPLFSGSLTLPTGAQSEGGACRTAAGGGGGESTGAAGRGVMHSDALVVIEVIPPVEPVLPLNSSAGSTSDASSTGSGTDRGGPAAPSTTPSTTPTTTTNSSLSAPPPTPPPQNIAAKNTTSTNTINTSASGLRQAEVQLNFTLQWDASAAGRTGSNSSNSSSSGASGGTQQAVFRVGLRLLTGVLGWAVLCVCVCVTVCKFSSP